MKRLLLLLAVIGLVSAGASHSSNVESAAGTQVCAPADCNPSDCDPQDCDPCVVACR